MYSLRCLSRSLISCVALSALLPTLALQSACFDDGENGDQNVVFFSQLVNFTETSNFSAPLAVGKTVFVALEHADQTGSLNAFPELELKINGDASSVFGFGFAQYGFSLDTAGTYSMEAHTRTGMLDHLTIRAEPLKRIRPHAVAKVTTFGDVCTFTNEIDLDNLVLHSNQEVEIEIVPVSANEEPMLGLLGLVATGPSFLSLDSPTVSEGGRPNALRLTPTGFMNEDVKLQITEVQDNVDIVITIPVDNSPAPISCEG